MTQQTINGPTEQALFQAIRELSKEELEVYALGCAVIAAGLLTIFAMSEFKVGFLGPVAFQINDVSEKVAKRTAQIIRERN